MYELLFYSLDVREKVIVYVKEGKGKMEAVKIFKIHRKTIYRWGKREKQEG
jgi:transposase